MGNSYSCSVLFQNNLWNISNRYLLVTLQRRCIPFGGYVHRSILFSHYRHVSSRYFVGRPYYLQLRTSHRLSNNDVDELELKFDAIRDKIIFNSIFERSKLNWIQKKILQGKQDKLRISKINKKNPIDSLPIALKYLKETENYAAAQEQKSEDNVENEVFCLPYSIETDVEKHEQQNAHSMFNNNVPELNSEELSVDILRDHMSKPNISEWMSDYECYVEMEDYDINEQPWELNYGTPNLNVPSSNVPCGGCGALLHCQDSAIPGYLPSEIFENQDEVTLRSIVCQRCHFMKHYDTALNVIVAPDEYPRLMSQIKEKVALIVLMFDLLDFPCSIWPGIMDIIGNKHPVVVVGNKIDLLPPDSRGYLHRIKECLTVNLNHCGIPDRNIKHVALISAMTGYGVEELITKLHSIWEYRGDVFLVGCTNVGKSTLFNALLQSDFCKVKAIDLVQRATTSPWPGTTINLLKFPILRPAGWRLYERTKRLLAERKDVVAERKLRYSQMKTNAPSGKPALIGHIGMTFYKKTPNLQKDPFAISKGISQEVMPLSGLDPSDPSYEMSKWCYDTPGAVHPDQVIHLLTTDELRLTLPKKLLLPRTFRIAPSISLFIAGLGRIDYLHGDESIRLTVFASRLLPITVCRTSDAEELYSNLLGSKFLAVPHGGPVRLAQWPGLEPHPELLELEGIGAKESCGDVLLSSAGWIAFTLRKGKKGTFRCWTPNAKGVYLRKPSLLPFAVNLCGPRVRRSPAYARGKAVFQKSI